MTVKSRTFKSLALFLPCILVGCATIDNRGHVVEPVQLEKIKVGVTKKEQVAELLGTPSSVSTFGNNTWFYMSEVTQRRAFFNPVILKSNITRIDFNDQGRVVALDSLSEKDRQVVSHIQRSTPTAGHTFSVVEQIFGNVGRFNGKDPDAERPRR
ncbi:MAG: SmpA/OmlA protein [uncultured bacterium]|nr:MAG: SmpA/OmlA protein [uncultured bacterium]